MSESVADFRHARKLAPRVAEGAFAVSSPEVPWPPSDKFDSSLRFRSCARTSDQGGLISYAPPNQWR
jgi:hypothetical protein